MSDRARPDPALLNRADYATRFKPGKSGNPKGRPKGISFGDVLRARISKRDPEDEARRTRLEKIVDALIASGEKGEASAIKEIADRLDGRPRQQVEVIESRPKTLDELALIDGTPTPRLVRAALKLIEDATGVQYAPINRDDPGGGES